MKIRNLTQITRINSREMTKILRLASMVSYYEVFQNEMIGYYYMNIIELWRINKLFT